MDVFTLDSAFDRVDVIDGYESLIWTERYSSCGDFNLTASPTLKMRGLLKLDTYLSIKESDRVMIIENVILAKVNGKNMLKVSGRSLESLLGFRAVRPGSYEWYVRSTAGDIVRDLVWRICVVGNAFSPNDVIPGLAAEDLSLSTTIIDTTVKFQALYSAVKELCDSENLGFRISLKDTAPRLQFTVYSGIARPELVFSTELDTLVDPSHLLSQEAYMNIAYVLGKNGVQVVAAPGVDINIQGSARRVLTVDAMDIDPDSTPLSAEEYINMLNQRGLEALATHKKLNAFDGEVPDTAPYKYNEHYFQGDIVSLSGDGDVKKDVRVTEYIWIYDAEGRRSYPTFTEI